MQLSIVVWDVPGTPGSDTSLKIDVELEKGARSGPRVAQSHADATCCRTQSCAIHHRHVRSRRLRSFRDRASQSGFTSVVSSNAFQGHRAVSCGLGSA